MSEDVLVLPGQLPLPLVREGFHDDIPEDAYHADSATVSQSGAKLILAAPALFHWQSEHPEPPKDVFAFGSAAHRLILGVGPKITIIQREIKNRKGELIEIVDADDLKTDSAKADRDAIRERGEIPLLAKDYAKVQAMADKLSEHRLAMELLSEGRPEVTAYAEDPATEVTMRGRFDWLGDHTISDYKTSVTSEPDAFVRHAINYGYDLQAAWYLDLARLCGHPATGFAFIVQEKEPPYLVTVIILPPELIDRGKALKRRALERYRDCVASDIWPGYVPDDEFATPAAPAWALREIDDW